MTTLYYSHIVSYRKYYYPVVLPKTISSLVLLCYWSFKHSGEILQQDIIVSVHRLGTVLSTMLLRISRRVLVTDVQDAHIPPTFRERHRAARSTTLLLRMLPPQTSPTYLLTPTSPHCSTSSRNLGSLWSRDGFTGVPADGPRH